MKDSRIIDLPLFSNGLFVNRVMRRQGASAQPQGCLLVQASH